MARHETSPADAELRVTFRGGDPFDQFDPRPDTAGILPAAAGSAEPFAQQRPGEHQPALVSRSVPVRDAAWPVARMQTLIRAPED